MNTIFIMMVGFSRSGKTTFVNEIIKKNPNFTVVNTDFIHDFLNQTYPIFKDDNTINGQAFELRQKVTKKIQIALITTLLESGKSVILDACNGERKKRNNILSMVKNIPNIKTIIIRHKIDEEVLYQNIKKADQAGGSIWKDLYEKVQKPNFNEPSINEADILLINDNNSEIILKEINNLVFRI